MVGNCSKPAHMVAAASEILTPAIDIRGLDPAQACSAETIARRHVPAVRCCSRESVAV
jgi:hypothetical protein